MTDLLRSPKADLVNDIITFMYDENTLSCHQGDTIASALLASGESEFSASRVDGSPRGLFCGMGLCQECIVYIDGIACEACRTVVEHGMKVTSCVPTE